VLIAPLASHSLRLLANCALKFDKGNAHFKSNTEELKRSRVYDWKRSRRRNRWSEVY